jgi:hypothetical protein
MSRYIDKNGYVRSSREQYEHRLIVQDLTGLELTKEQVVHHLDYNSQNNSPSNLVVCPSQSYHMLLHARTDALNRGQNLKTEGYCGRCGNIKLRKEFSKNKRMVFGIHNICNACQASYKKEKGLNLRKNRVNNWKDNLNQQYRRILTNYSKREISWLVN